MVQRNCASRKTYKFKNTYRRKNLYTINKFCAGFTKQGIKPAFLHKRKRLQYDDVAFDIMVF